MSILLTRLKYNKQAIARRSSISVTPACQSVEEEARRNNRLFISLPSLLALQTHVSPSAGRLKKRRWTFAGGLAPVEPLHTPHRLALLKAPYFPVGKRNAGEELPPCWGYLMTASGISRKLLKRVFIEIAFRVKIKKKNKALVNTTATQTRLSQGANEN